MNQNENEPTVRENNKSRKLTLQTGISVHHSSGPALMPANILEGLSGFETGSAPVFSL